MSSFKMARGSAKTGGNMRPLSKGSFIHRIGEGVGELVVGQLGLISSGRREHIPKNKDGKRRSISNARGEKSKDGSDQDA